MNESASTRAVPRQSGVAASDREPSAGAADRRNLIAVALVASAARVVLLAGFSPRLTTDSYGYLELAHRLGGWNLSGYSGTRTPGYPLLLLAVGYSPRAMWWLQALLGVLAAVLLYRLTRRLGARPGLALGASLFYAIDLEVLGLEHLVLTETVASLLILVAASIAVEIAGAPERRRRALVLLSLTLAGLCLVRPDATALAAYLAVALGVLTAGRGPAVAGERRRRLSRATRRAAIVLLGPVLAMVAWTAVNRATIGVTTVSTVLGHNMIDHVAAYVRAEPGRNFAIERAYVAARAKRRAHTSDLSNLSGDAEAAMERASGLDAAHLSGRLLDVALGVIASHPAQYVASSLKQWPRFFVAPNYAYTFHGAGASVLRAIWKPERAIKLAMALLFLVVCCMGLVRRRAGLLSHPAAVIAGLVGVGLVVATFFAFGDTGRYGYVYWPVMLAVGVAALEPLRSRLGALAPRRRTRPADGEPPAAQNRAVAPGSAERQAVPGPGR